METEKKKMGRKGKGGRGGDGKRKEMEIGRNMIFSSRICRVLDTRTRISHSTGRVVADIMVPGLARKQHKLHKTKERQVECAGHQYLRFSCYTPPATSSG